MTATDIYGETATDLFDLEIEEVAPPKPRNTKRRVRTSSKPTIELPESLKAYDYDLDDAHAPVNVKQYAENILPYFIMLENSPSLEGKLFHNDSPLRQASGCSTEKLDKSDMTADSFFTDMPALTDDFGNDLYVEGKASPEYQIAYRRATIERLKAKRQCGDCPLLKMCAASSLIAGRAINEFQKTTLAQIDHEEEIEERKNKSKSTYPEVQLKEALDNSRLKKKMAAEYDTSNDIYTSTMMPGIFGGLSAYDRAIVVHHVENLRDQYNAGKEALRKEIAQTDADFDFETMMTVDQLMAIDTEMKRIARKYASAIDY